MNSNMAKESNLTGLHGLNPTSLECINRVQARRGRGEGDFLKDRKQQK